MALPPRKRKDIPIDALGCQETLEDHDEDLAALSKRLRESLEDDAPGEMENISGYNSSGHATLQVDAGDYECSICLQILVDPVVGSCGHDYCLTCLEDWKASSSRGRGVTCPACRQMAMPPGLQSLGICRRLQRVVEAAYPERVAARRAEIAAVKLVRESSRRREIDDQVSTVQAMLRARLATVSETLAASTSYSQQQQQQPQQPHVVASASAATLPQTLPSVSFQQQEHQTSSASQPAVHPQQARATPAFPRGYARSMWDRLDRMYNNAPVDDDSSEPSMPLEPTDTDAAPVAPLNPAAPTVDMPAVEEPVEGERLPTADPLVPNEATNADPVSVAAVGSMPWQRPEEDVGLREEMAERLVVLFHAKRPAMEDAFKARLPRLVRKLEEGLYRSALSREQYGDSETLESRVQGLVRQLMGRGGGTSGEAIGTDAFLVAAPPSSAAPDMPPWTTHFPILESYDWGRELPQHPNNPLPDLSQFPPRTAAMLASVSPLPASMLPSFWWHHGLPPPPPQQPGDVATSGQGPFMAMGFPLPSLSHHYLV